VPAPADWCVTGTAESRHNVIKSIFLEPELQENFVRKLEAKYQEAERTETRAECWRTEDAEIVLVGYGIVGRILKAVVALARANGIRAGLLRPITLYPFPVEQVRAAARQAKAFVTVELSNGQMVDDVRLALGGSRPVEFFGRMGGMVPTAEEVLEFVERKFGAVAAEVLAHV
jgi:pyruvate/2-oxoacid:ferredoxin oxidoreductase alpha subunit